MPDDIGKTPSGELAPPGEPTVEGAPQPIQEPPGEPGYEPTIPEKFQGKSVEEIAQSYLELERKLGEQAQELGELRQRVPPMPYPAPPQGYAPPGYYPPGYPAGAPVYTPPPPPREPLKMNWENPVETLRQLVKEEVVPVVAGYQQNAARGMKDIAFENAKAKDPALFEGVEPNVKEFMDSMIDQGVLRPDSALSPETWRMAAWQMQGMKSGYKPRPAGPPLQPVPSVRTEIPGSRPPYSGPSGPPLNEADRRMTAKMGLTEEQARKNMAGRK